MSDPIRQHYVPRLYLKNFAFTKNNSLKIYAIEKFSKKIFESNIENIAVEKDFYTVNRLSDKYAWEKFYANSVEPEMNKLIKNIIAKDTTCLLAENSIVLNNEKKWMLANCLVFQMMRSINLRSYEEKLFEDIAPAILTQVSEEFNEKGQY